MRIESQYWEWIRKPEEALSLIETAGRTCYKSEEKITHGSAERFAAMLIRRGHESVIEHATATVRFFTNRGVTHELVRHRLASYSQESTRYVRYTGEMIFIRPVWWDDWPQAAKSTWTQAMQAAESAYLALIEAGGRPEQAREVLPQSLKAEIVVTANLREWRHIFRLRSSPAAHPQIRALMRDCLRGFAGIVPLLFDDLIASIDDTTYPE